MTTNADTVEAAASTTARESTSKGNSGGKAGWFLLGAAALLAAGSIGYNVYDGGDDSAQTADSGDNLPTIEELRAAAEASTDDARPWAELAFAHFERGEFADSVAAYERAIEIDDAAAELWSALGEARVMALDAASAAADPMPQSALDAFAKALELDPTDPRARYFLAVKQDIDGDHNGAISSWLALLSDTPPGAPWEGDVVRTIQQVGAINDIDVEQRLATVMEGRTPEVLLPGSGTAAGEAASPSLPGPSAQQVADAGRLNPTEQRNMAVGMVERLEGRLENDPSNIDGWVMLMRSRMTLGEPDRAKQALNDAIAANPSRAGELRAAADQLGIR
jgi:cytochrome c-type biogenesis protein CcmH